MDVLDFLKQEHKEVSALIDRVQKAEPEDERVRELGEEISRALTVHAALEEAMFYPILRDRAEESAERVDVFEAFTEHDVVKHLISLLKGRRTKAEVFKAELQVLGESVKHHVREEESTIFSLARELLNDEEREELGAAVMAEKERLTRSPGRGRKKSPAKTSSSKKSSSKKSTPTKSTARKGARRKTRKTR